MSCKIEELGDEINKKKLKSFSTIEIERRFRDYSENSLIGELKII